MKQSRHERALRANLERLDAAVEAATQELRDTKTRLQALLDQRALLKGILDAPDGERAPPEARADG